MGYIKRNRQCNVCDCRDAITYTGSPLFNPLACTNCGALPPPCHYIAHFPCAVVCGGVTVASTSVPLQPLCPFEDSCIFTDSQSANTTGDCTSTGGRGTSVTATHWTLDTGLGTLTYSVSGVVIIYTASTTWDCYGPNTLAFTSLSGATCSKLPINVCITPVQPTYPLTPVADAQICIPTDGGAFITYQSNDYDSEANRIACCDPYCHTAIGAISIRDSGGQYFDTTNQPTSVGIPVAGINAPSGLSRYNQFTANLHFGGNVRAVFYCSMGTWYADIYNSASATPTVFVFVNTLTLSHQCCFLLGTSTTLAVPLITGGTPPWEVCVSFGTGSTAYCFPCTGNCDYTAAVDGTTPTGFKWVFSARGCNPSCSACPTVNAAFYVAHGYPALITDTLSVACTHS